MRTATCLCAFMLVAAHAQDPPRVQPTDAARAASRAGDYRGAEALLGPEIAACIRTHGEAIACLDLLEAGAVTKRQAGKPVEAEALARRALAIARKAYGERHADTATAWHELAYDLVQQGRYSVAEPCYRTALDIRRAVLGERDPETAATYDNLAGAIGGQGRLAEAEALYRKALEIRRAFAGAGNSKNALRGGTRLRCGIKVVGIGAKGRLDVVGIQTDQNRPDRGMRGPPLPSQFKSRVQPLEMRSDEGRDAAIRVGAGHDRQDRKQQDIALLVPFALGTPWIRDRSEPCQNGSE